MPEELRFYAWLNLYITLTSLNQDITNDFVVPVTAWATIS